MGIWYSEYKNGLVFLKVDRYAHRIRQFHQHAPATPQTTMDKQADDPQQSPSRCAVWSANGLLIWSAAYGFLHLLWALGIGLFMLRPSALEISLFGVANVVTAVLLTAVGFLGLILIRLRRGSFLSWLLLAITWAGCSLATSHGIYGIVYRLLQITGAVGLEAGPFNPMEHAYVLWDLLLFEPWFTIEGILLAVLGWCTLSQARHRRIWLVLCIAGILLGLVTGLLGVQIG
jgi:hypothetical protein